LNNKKAMEKEEKKRCQGASVNTVLVAAAAPILSSWEEMRLGEKGGTFLDSVPPAAENSEMIRAREDRRVSEASVEAGSRLLVAV
jgi:hypothetical protein